MINCYRILVLIQFTIIRFKGCLTSSFGLCEAFDDGPLFLPFLL